MSPEEPAYGPSRNPYPGFHLIPLTFELSFRLWSFQTRLCGGLPAPLEIFTPLGHLLQSFPTSHTHKWSQPSLTAPEIAQGRTRESKSSFWSQAWANFFHASFMPLECSPRARWNGCFLSGQMLVLKKWCKRLVQSHN